MNGQDVRSVPLTLCWRLYLYRGHRRFAIGTTRAPGGRIIGLCIALFGRMAAVTRIGPTPSGVRDPWFWDRGRWSVGGWRTDRTVPLSTGWVTGHRGHRLGITVTVACRTLYVMTLYSRAEHRDRKAGRW